MGEYPNMERKRPLSTVKDAKLQDSRKNTAIYVTGLPEDTTLDELSEYFSKYGVIMNDMFTNGPRIKMYENTDGIFKGEALIVYLKEESAIMAVEILDGSYFRPNILIKVEKAHFEKQAAQNDSENSSNLPDNLKIDKKLWKQHMQQMNKKLEWTENDSVSPEEEALLKAELRKREKYQRIVVLRGMFTAEEAQSDPSFVLDLKEDLLAECEKLGEVTSIHVLTDLLICTVKFREKEPAMTCLRMMQGRYFAGHRIFACLYDGSFSLKEQKSKEVESETEERLEKFAEWLETDPVDRDPNRKS